jgi:hypothetical protein
LPSFRRIVRLAIAVAVVAASFGARPAAAATDRLPDLRMANLTSFYTENSGGERRLRFTTIMTNEGAGPLEVRGTRANLGESHLRTQQAIYNTDGGVRLAGSRALMEYAVDGHDHWHIQGVMLYQMWSNNGVVRRGTKVGFCFLDSRPWILSLPGAPQSGVYGERACGDSGDLANRMGLSVGWGDEYPANFAYQWIDITTLEPGDYTVQARADEQNWYLESNETNNCSWARVRITETNGPVSVLSSWSANTATIDMRPRRSPPRTRSPRASRSPTSRRVRPSRTHWRPEPLPASVAGRSSSSSGTGFPHWRPPSSSGSTPTGPSSSGAEGSYRITSPRWWAATRQAAVTRASPVPTGTRRRPGFRPRRSPRAWRRHTSPAA